MGSRCSHPPTRCPSSQRRNQNRGEKGIFYFVDPKRQLGVGNADDSQKSRMSPFRRSLDQRPTGTADQRRRRVHYPGCAARPWALMLNAFGVCRGTVSRQLAENHEGGALGWLNDAPSKHSRAKLGNTSAQQRQTRAESSFHRPTTKSTKNQVFYLSSCPSCPWRSCSPPFCDQLLCPRLHLADVSVGSRSPAEAGYCGGGRGMLQGRGPGRSLAPVDEAVGHHRGRC